jgi:hypothetical protein
MPEKIFQSLNAQTGQVCCTSGADSLEILAGRLKILISGVVGRHKGRLSQQVRKR